jgi:mono/diheme cytochrome c family protein
VSTASLIALVVTGVVATTPFVVTAQTRPSPTAPRSSGGGEPHGDPRGWTFKLPGGGDPGRGRSAFEKFECYACHEVRSDKFPAPTKRDSIGPELSAMGQHHSPAFLAESIMNPSGRIDKGQAYAGADGSSKMPSFADSMTVQELLDLVAYLKNLRPPPARKGHHH